jgi:hypothetical protein
MLSLRRMRALRFVIAYQRSIRCPRFADDQENAFWELFWLFMCPPVICLGIALIVYTIGVAGLAGIAISR